jgi:hypothetical protein
LGVTLLSEFHKDDEATDLPNLTKGEAKWVPNPIPVNVTIAEPVTWREMGDAEETSVAAKDNADINALDVVP